MNDLSGSDRVLSATNQLRDFETRASPNGLFLRYCRARYRSVRMRHIMTAIGTFGLIAAGHFGIAALCFALAVIGEWVDFLVLRRLWRRYREADLPGSARRLAMVSGVFQALTIASCVAVVWIGIGTPGAAFFAIAFLFGTAINAGIIRPYFPAGADSRLAVYVTFLAALVLREGLLRRHDDMVRGEHVLFAIAIVTFCAIAAMFILFVVRTHEQRRRFEHALLTEKRRLELSRSELAVKERAAQRLALVARHANDVVIITDAGGRIEWVNDTFTRTTGFTPAEVVGRYPGDILNTDETDPAAIAEIQSARQEARPTRVEILNRNKNGEAVWVETSLTPVFGPDGRHQMTVAVERDISEMKDREAELARARAEAEDAAQAKSRFLATMSHEIRTPMNGVIGTAQLLSETDLDDRQKHYVDLIVESGEALLTIINDILDLSKLQAGKPLIDPRPFDIASCLAAAVEILAPVAGARGVTLELTAGASPPLLIGDPGRLRQILINLIGNAVKFTPKGRVDVRMATRASGTMIAVEIAVADTGIGIPADRLDHIFDSFAQAHDGISRSFGGTGLGLTISRLLAREMGGDIAVRSEPGAGSVFTVSLALAVAAGSTPEPAPPDLSTAAARLAGKRILIAEDNRTNRMIVARMLADIGLDLAFADDGEAAVERFVARPPDLVLMDVSMPILDGLDATREIRRRERRHGLGRCPVIALTANAFAEDRDACLAAGMDGFLSKPVRRDDLLARLCQHLVTTPPRSDVSGL